jgi:hypothetical protein
MQAPLLPTAAHDQFSTIASNCFLLATSAEQLQMQAPASIQPPLCGVLPNGKPLFVTPNAHECFKPGWQANPALRTHGCPDPSTPKCQLFLSPVLSKVDDIATIFSAQFVV